MSCGKNNLRPQLAVKGDRDDGNRKIFILHEEKEMKKITIITSAVSRERESERVR